MPTAAQDHSFSEEAQFGFGFGQCIIEPRHLLLEQHFRLVTLRRERVQSEGEAVVEDRQFGNAFGWNDA
jgi:hypothetical protein